MYIKQRNVYDIKVMIQFGCRYMVLFTEYRFSKAHQGRVYIIRGSARMAVTDKLCMIILGGKGDESPGTMLVAA